MPRGLPHTDSRGLLGYLEIILGSISQSTNRLFASYGPTRWQAVEKGFMVPTNTLNDAGFWQLIMDQLSNIQHLVKANLWGLVYESLDKLLRFESIDRNTGLHFLVFIWRICLLLMKIKINGMDRHATIRQRWEQPETDTHVSRGQRQEPQPRRALPRPRVPKLPSNPRQCPEDEARGRSQPNTGHRQTNKMPLSNFAILGVFLYRLHGRLANLPRNNPMRRLAMALSCAFVAVRERADFKIVLRDGFRRTIECLTAWAGESHPAPLGMKSDFAKHWKLAEPDSEACEVAHHHQQPLASDDPWHSLVSQLYENSRAVFKGKNDDQKTEHSMLRLYALASVACGQKSRPDDEQVALDSCNLPHFVHRGGRCLKWGLYPKTLAFSADAIAKIRLERHHQDRRRDRHIKPSKAKRRAKDKDASAPNVDGKPSDIDATEKLRKAEELRKERDEMLSIVQRAIETLRVGDWDCLNSALSLSKSLATWYKGSLSDRKKALAQKEISSGIVAQIKKASAGEAQAVELVRG
jgi:hypothetical protein